MPDKKIAIEYNGVYWHSTKNNPDKEYHYKKWKICKDRGVELITIWEDDWKLRNKAVKGMLHCKLQLDEGCIHTKETEVVNLGCQDATPFLDDYHIQGASLSDFCYGLVDSGGKIVAVSSWKRDGAELYLNRYAASTLVVGGLEKLLKRGVKYASSQGLKRVVAFSDHELSSGGIYEELGFRSEGCLPVDYKYVIGGVRISRDSFQKDFFSKNDKMESSLELNCSDSTSLNDISRVYDCGKTKWVLQIKN